MRTRFSRAFAAACVGLFALSQPSFGLPVPSGAGTQALPLPKPRPVALSPQTKPAVRLSNVQPVTQRRARVERPLASEPVSMSARMKPPFHMPALVAEARKYMGTNPTARSRLWCATFMNFVLAKLGYAGTNSDAAKSFAYYGQRISEPRVGAIAVLTRGKNGGHVGVVSGVDKGGNPIIISGNHNKRVGEAVYARARVIAYVMPTERRPMPTQVAERSRPASELGFESPITELLAAIEAEQARAEPPRAQQAQAPAPPQPMQTQRPAPPQTPHRIVQQTAEPVLPAQPRAVPQRARGRVAAAETGRGIR